MQNLLYFLTAMRWLGIASALAFGLLAVSCGINCFGLKVPLPLGAWLSMKSGIMCNPAMLGLMLFFTLVASLLMLTAMLASDALER